MGQPLGRWPLALTTLNGSLVSSTSLSGMHINQQRLTSGYKTTINRHRNQQYCISKHARHHQAPALYQPESKPNDIAHLKGAGLSQSRLDLPSSTPWLGSAPSGSARKVDSGIALHFHLGRWHARPWTSNSVKSVTSLQHTYRVA